MATSKPKAAPKTASADAWPEGFKRRFEHADGRYFTLQWIGARLHEAWGKGAKGHGATSMRDDADEALKGAEAKVRKWRAEGFVEVASEPGIRFDADADVIETMRSARSYVGEMLFDLRPFEGRTHVFETAHLGGCSWLVCSPGHTRAIEVRTSTREIAAPFLDLLEKERERIFEDASTPVHKWRLAAPIGRLTHGAMLSPEVVNHAYFPQLGRSIWAAFPCFDCELVGDESATVADARTRGHGAIPRGSWTRAPHPVLDVRVVKRIDKDEKAAFLVHEPRTFDKLVSTAALAKLRAPAIELRNYAREVRRFAKGEVIDDQKRAELRAWLGFID